MKTKTSITLGTIVVASSDAAGKYNTFARVVGETATRMTLQPLQALVESRDPYGQSGLDFAGDVDTSRPAFTAMKYELGDMPTLRTGTRGCRKYFRAWDGKGVSFYGD